MLPFSKRPPSPEEYFLHSGDFEDADSGSASERRPEPQRGRGPSEHGFSSRPIASAPLPSVFARQAAHSPDGFSQSRSYSQHGPLSAPTPPHSLAPVMSDQSFGGPAGSTGPQRAQTRVSLREKTSLKWGVMIALSGALLGGVLGLGIDANRQRARAAAAAAGQARDLAPALLVTLPPTPIPMQAAPSGLDVVPATDATAVVAVPAAASTLGATATAPSIPADDALELAAELPVGTRATVLPLAQPIAVTGARDRHTTSRPARPVHPGIAPPKTNPPKRPEKPPAKPAGAANDDPVSKGPSDERRLLEDAIKDTTNTL